jgi:hypothetical protein
VAAAAPLGGCGQPSNYQGSTLRVSGDFNAWSTSDQALSLSWDDERQLYHGVVTLPGDRLSLRLYAPATGQLVGLSSPSTSDAAVPSTLTATISQAVSPIAVATPLPTRYVVDYTPASGQLHIDLADDAETGLPAAAAAVVTALRGADQLAASDRMQRATTLRQTLTQLAAETPVQVGDGDLRGLLFLHLTPVDHPTLSLVGDFNSWMAGHDPMQVVLDGTVSYLGRRASGVRIEYRFDLHGLRYPDPGNLEIAWDGAYLPPNPGNLLGGDEGEYNSVAFAPGYVEPGARLRRLLVLSAQEAPALPEVYISLPPGYDQAQAARYPTLYVYDGKDALVRGHYDTALQRLAASSQIPSLIGVFVASPADSTTRLSAYANFTDPGYPDITPHGADTTKLLYDLVPLVEKTYRTTTPRALLGIDIAGPNCFLQAWQDPQHRFTRLASQSGRFGWGDAQLVTSPYIHALGVDMSQYLERLSLDYSDSDPPQAQGMVQDAVHSALSQSGYTGKVQLNRQSTTTSQLWDGLRSRLDDTLTFLLRDLVKHP